MALEVDLKVSFSCKPVSANITLVGPLSGVRSATLEDVEIDS